MMIFFQTAITLRTASLYVSSSRNWSRRTNSLKIKKRGFNRGVIGEPYKKHLSSVCKERIVATSKRIAIGNYQWSADCHCLRMSRLQKCVRKIFFANILMNLEAKYISEHSEETKI